MLEHHSSLAPNTLTFYSDHSGFLMGGRLNSKKQRTSKKEGTRTSNVGGVGSIPGWETNIPHTAQYSKKKKKEIICCLILKNFNPNRK